MQKNTTKKKKRKKKEEKKHPQIHRGVGGDQATISGGPHLGGGKSQ